MMFVPHRKHAYRPPWPVRGMASAFITFPETGRFITVLTKASPCPGPDESYHILVL
jgi:hypothetical protein